MRILITGSNGMLGSDLVDVLSPEYQVIGLGASANHHPQIDYLQADVSDPPQVDKAVSQIKPAIIVHTAAYTDVDGCELDPNRAYLINTKGAELIGEASDRAGGTLIFISSDYVFDGTKKAPYLETDVPNPVSVYGKSKFQAEEWLKANCKSVSIIRSSWLFGKNGRNFFRAILKRLGKREGLSVVDDQKGAPTYTLDLAEGLKQLIERARRPKGFEIYHLANTGSTTWYGAAKKLVEKTGQKVDLKPISSAELNRPAKRPANSVFDQSKIKSAYQIQLRSWEDALNHYWEHTLRHEP